MKAHAHGLTGSLAWLGGCLAATSVGIHVSPVAVIGGTAVATGMAIAPDMDVQGTAARALGWPSRIVSYGIMWMTSHRGATHWASTGAVISLAVALTAAVRWNIHGVSAPWAAALTLVLGYAWCIAAAEADNSPSRRMGAAARWLAAIISTAITLRVDQSPAWLGPAVLAGWYAHIGGDCMTTDRWPILAPLIWREFGGWRIIRPTPEGKRVTRTERVIETLLFAGCLVIAFTLVRDGHMEIGALTHSKIR
jgi:hypothetical protein